MVSKSVVRGLLLGLAVGAVVLGSGCSDPESKRPSTTQPVIKYQSVGLRQVPDYLKGTIYEQTNVRDDKPFLSTGFGLVTHLRQTGDNSGLPQAVHDYMIKEMQRHGFGSHRIPGYENISPEGMLRDSRNAVVRLDGYIPVGARKGDRFDVLVQALPESYTVSLSGGVLYEADLKYNGADPNNPIGSVNVYARASGPVCVNPTYALANPRQLDTNGKASVLYGVVMGGGISTFDSPLSLIIREPQFSTSRIIEKRINQRFQQVADHTNRVGDLGMAEALDEGIVHVYVPRIYRGDWEHFMGVVKHLYLNGNPGVLAQNAQRLAEAAVRPNAPLENISYALEGIGQPAMGVLSKLMTNPSPDVQFAAARAAAFISAFGGEDTGEAREVLARIAKTPDHPYRVTAVKVLADLPDSVDTAQELRQLVNSDNPVVRVEAYKALARNNDQYIFSKTIQDKFIIDVVPSSGQPMIYASRRGVPRLAIFGARQALHTPLTFSTMDARLTITANEPNGPVTLFYRSSRAEGDMYDGVVRQLSRPDLGEVIARLGGEAGADEHRLDFGYSDVVAMIQQMSAANKFAATTLDGQEVPVLVSVEEQTGQVADASADAPQIPDAGRAQTNGKETEAPQIPDTQQPAAKNTQPPKSNGRQN